MPKFLPAGTVQRFLDQCERSTPDGKRNYAVLLLLGAGSPLILQKRTWAETQAAYALEQGLLAEERQMRRILRLAMTKTPERRGRQGTEKLGEGV